ncbi:MAG TPA: toll/interleukin-1 receptor domain-containing protein [Dehalococcoidia bacterium]|nr:toll/interleukin-1 receptor domain-containing protein [Dehalococcoidia bacterium]
MANQEHLRIVGQGREAIEVWRQTHPDIPLDLREAVLPQANLGRANLGQADLREANLSGATLFRADLSHAQLEHCNLSGAELSRASLGQANLSEANLVKANLGGADLDGANLSGANLFQADLIQCSLHGANLGRAVLSEAVLRRAFLTNADLRRAVLTTTDLLQADLGQADLRWSILRRADLGGVNLAGADLSGADLTFTTFDNTNLDHTQLSEARLDGTVIIGCDLSSVLGLEAVEHLGPSSVGLDTIARSRGKIPVAFLQGIGLSDTMITHVRAMAAERLQGVTCFIAYGSQDQPLADRLHTDLQKQGVRCWYYPDITGTNRRVWENLERSVRAFDKVVVICSEASLKTQAVVDEVERALAREVPETPRPAGADQRRKSRSKGQEVLFPIRVGEYVLDGWQHPRQGDVAARATADFTGWDRAPRKYRRALGQLLHALEPTTWPAPK